MHHSSADQSTHSPQGDPWVFNGVGPASLTAEERIRFFSFYKKHKSRRLHGYFKDIQRSPSMASFVARSLGSRRKIDCIILGCSHWANPRDAAEYLKSRNKSARIRITALDVLPEALVEGVKKGVDFLPVQCAAQSTPFLNAQFDVLVADGLLNCCGFDQHAAIISEMSRIAKRHAIVFLGLANSDKTTVIKTHERAMPAHCRPLAEFRQMFEFAGFRFPSVKSIETPFASEFPAVIDNCIARRI